MTALDDMGSETPRQMHALLHARVRNSQAAWRVRRLRDAREAWPLDAAETGCVTSPRYQAPLCSGMRAASGRAATKTRAKIA